MSAAAIGQLERVAALGWRAPEERWLGEWLLRAAHGFTGRANAALAIGDPGLPHDEAVGAVLRWYRDRGLPPMITICYPLDGIGSGAGPGPWAGSGLCAEGLDAFLAGAGWHVRAGRAIVMTAAAPDVPRWRQGQAGVAVEFGAEPGDEWLSLYRHRGKPPPPIARHLLVSAPSQVFATIRTAGTAVAIGRLALADGWGGLTAIEVHPAHRRLGLGTLVTAALTSAASSRGATRMYLQVEDDNVAAMRLYARCGFTPHHRYHYRVAPAQAL